MRPLTLKIIVAGPGGVGKTTLLRRYQSGKFIPASTTIGINFITHSFESNGRNIILSIWDYAGEERYKVLFPGYCSGSSGALAVFDLTRPETIEFLVDWIEIIKEKNKNIPVHLIGTKTDVCTNERLQFMAQSANDFVKENNLVNYHFVSSKSGDGIIELFDSLTNSILSFIIKI